MSLKRYTDPTIHLRIQGVDLTGATVYATFAQDENVVTVQGNSLAVSYDGENTHIDASLTQEQTALFTMNKYSKSVVEVQVNWVKNSKRNATNPLYINLEKNLIERTL